ncbi:hypothetical protein COBT_000836 [Conglomerata obtusa]
MFREKIIEILKKSSCETLTCFLALPAIIEILEKKLINNIQSLKLNFYVYITCINILSILVGFDWNYNMNFYYNVSNYYGIFFKTRSHILKCENKRQIFCMVLLCVIRPFISPEHYMTFWEKTVIQGFFFCKYSTLTTTIQSNQNITHFRIFLFQILDSYIFIDERDDITCFYKRSQDDGNIQFKMFILKCSTITELKKYLAKKGRYLALIQTCRSLLNGLKNLNTKNNFIIDFEIIVEKFELIADSLRKVNELVTNNNRENLNILRLSLTQSVKFFSLLKDAVNLFSNHFIRFNHKQKLQLKKI